MNATLPPTRIKLRPLHPLFVAEVTGVDLRHPLDDATFAEIYEAFETHSVLVFRDQDIDDAQQVAFSERFGPLEVMLKGAVGQNSKVAGITNVDPATNEIIPVDDQRMLRQYGNELWHTDSSFKRIPALASLLSGREVPPEGGDTELASLRAAWDDLPEEKKALLDGLVAEHSFVYSRMLATGGKDFMSEEQKAQVPPVPQALVRANPTNGRKSLFIASHASHVIGWPVEKGRALLDELMAHATQPKYVYVHKWKPKDLVVWDNRSTLHRGRPYDYVNHRRRMVRTTVAGDAPTA